MRAKLTVYQVDRCGYYAFAAATPTCCNLQSCLGDIDQWINAKRPTIEKTRTFNPDDDGAFLPVYCFDAAGKGGSDWLLTTWNETPSDDGHVGTVRRNDTAGEAGIHATTLPSNSIIGYGTHFWFLSDVSRLVTVRFDAQSLNGHAGLNRYLNGFLERFSPHVRFDPSVDDGDVFLRQVIGYAADGDSDEADDKLHPRFRSSLLRRDAEIAYIRNNRTLIKKVIRKGRPTDGDTVQRSVLDRVLTFVGADPNNRALPEKNFIFEVPYTPTASELDAIIERWQEEDHETWDDVGFDFKGDSRRRWLSNSTLKFELDLPDNLNDGAASVAPAGELLEALRPHRALVTA